MVFVVVGVKVADGKAVYKTGHSFEHLVSNFLAALQLLLFSFRPLVKNHTIHERMVQYARFAVYADFTFFHAETRKR